LYKSKRYIKGCYVAMIAMFKSLYNFVIVLSCVRYQNVSKYIT